MIPEWKLEWYLLGDLPAEEQAAISALERTDGVLRARIAALRASDAEMQDGYPLEAMAEKAMEKAAERVSVGPRGRFWPFWPAVGAGASAGAGGAPWRLFRGGVPMWAVPAVVCAVLLVVLPVRIFWANRADLGAFPDIILKDRAGAEASRVAAADRAKGGVGAAMASPSLEVWRKAGSSAERLAPEAAVSAGDVVQLRYIVQEPCYGALVSMDGRGVLTVHLSGDGGRAALLMPEGPVALGTSYRLDDAPKYEAFYLITAPDKFELDSVTKALEGAEHPLDDTVLPNERHVTAFTLIKSGGGGVN